MTVELQWQEDIHRRLLVGDPLASEELCERMLEQLSRYVRQRAANFPFIDQSDIETAAIDTLFGYILNPQTFDPHKLSLVGYLRMAAYRDMLNIKKSKERKSKRETTLAPVEEMEDAWNSIEDDHAPEGLQAALMKESAEEWDEWIREILPDAVERQVVFMMAEGERKTESFAEILGVQDLPLTEQTRYVKRVKDRLVKRLRRARERSETLD